MSDHEPEPADPGSDPGGPREVGDVSVTAAAGGVTAADATGAAKSGAAAAAPSSTAEPVTDAASTMPPADPLTDPAATEAPSLDGRGSADGADSPPPLLLAREAPDRGIGAPGDQPAAVDAADATAEPPSRQAADQAPATPLDEGRLRSAVEAILFVVDRPTTAVELAQVLDVPQPEVSGALRALRTELDAQCRGFELREVAGGWRLYTREEFAPYVERYVLDGQQARLTQAALETLAVIAYRQPVTRSRISAIRGVSVDGVIRTLLGRGLIEECGSEPDTGGLLYRTTPLFLEKLGLQSIDELPSLAPLLPELESVEDVAPSS